MIINKVEISNFFCFVGDNFFEFDKGLNIISAKNSGGKSHLFNAFHWTFFDSIYVDKELDTSKKEWKIASRLNVLPDFIIQNSKTNDILKSSIKITLTAEFHMNEEIKNEEVEYHFEREISFKNIDNKINPVSTTELSIWYVKNGETFFLEKGEHKWFIEIIFPVSIRKFMWFQGETVDELYDFSNPATLKYAINKISYYPIYENLVNVTKKSETSISEKVDKEVKKSKKLTEEQEQVLTNIEYSRNKITSLEDKKIEVYNELENVKEAIINEEEKLKGFDKYSHLKNALTKYEYDIKSINDKIEGLSIFGKEQFITKWMLNRCDDLIKASKTNIDFLASEVKSQQKSENPVPITLPGPEYVQQMLEDHICYICEREVEDNSPAYYALKARMEDYQNNQIQKILSDNLTELNRAKRNLLNELKEISVEVEKNDAEIEKFLKLRKKSITSRDNLFSDAGISSSSEIMLGSESAEKIYNKIRSLNSSKTALERRLVGYESEKQFEEKSLGDLLSKKSNFITDSEGNDISEAKAQKYIKLIHSVLAALKAQALSNLINEITIESNNLYTKYLGGRTQGEIEIDRGIRIIDKVTRKALTNLNTAELTAQKLAVANSFLSLSSKKMNRSFPLLADAPTSQFDDDNTLFLTENLSSSFAQIIIMSKDYNNLKGDEREAFIKKANISKYYELNNDLIDKSGPDSRTNKKTYKNVVK
jgi:DNA repair exonuclease SbcCD ATPase subunit